MADQPPVPDLGSLRLTHHDDEAAYQRTSRRRRYLLWGSFPALALLIVALLYATGVLPPAPIVDIATVSRIYPSQALSLLNASGYVVAQRKASVSSKSTGRLAILKVEEGSRVKQGEIIASLENADLEASRDRAAANVAVARAGIQQAQAELTDASLNFTRQKKLLQDDLVARQDFDAAEARYKKAWAAVASAQANLTVAQAALHEAQTTLDYSLIRAPFDGVILTKNAEIGEVVAPFGSAANARAAVATMADMDSLMVEADVAEANISLVKLDQPCEIQLDALPGVRFAGKVHMIVPTADRSKATILTKVAFLTPDERILPEMSAKVAFLSRAVRPDEEQPRLTVHPQALIQRKDQRQEVLVVRQGRVQLVPVTLGPKVGDLVEVTAGLQEGDRVVINPPKNLSNGDRVKVREG